MKRAFTLAEVLITLVIIGVIAALTIPTLMKANKRTETEAGLKKMYSVILTALKLSEIDNGAHMTWDFDNADFFNLYFKPYLKFSKLCTLDTLCENYTWLYSGGTDTGWPTTGEDGWSGGYLADGSYIKLASTGSEHCLNNPQSYGCVIFQFDINGQKGPNTFGKDIFWFSTLKTGKLVSPGMKGTLDNVNVEYGAGALNVCKTELYSGHSALYCTGWIMTNGWKIPDDYPWL